MQTETCSACGLITEQFDGPVHQYLVSSPGCWAKFGEILAREYENYEYMSVHALTVDTYALQHPGEASPQTISSAYIHLASLYSHFELEKPISELAEVKQNLAGYKDRFTWLEPPENVTEITVADILKSETPAQHREAVTRWATYVYQEWQAHHPKVASLLSIVDN